MSDTRSRTLKKIPTGESVFTASLKRINWVFDTFEHVCVSFSGGKDSTVMLHLTAQIAKKLNRKFSVLFVDWEVQYDCTIKHIEHMRCIYHEFISDFYWVALPLRTVNAVSQFEPEWTCWEKGRQWVRNPPSHAITQTDYFTFYYPGMTFEEFIPEFSKWLSSGAGLAMLVGVRADESLNRFLSIASGRKLRYSDDRPWTTASASGFWYNVYPLYDWKIKDIWHCVSTLNLACNPLYELMYQANVPLKQMRICEAFGPEQRRGLYLYQLFEPSTWDRMCVRVAGANSGARYANLSGAYFALNNTFNKPLHFSWRSYAMYLLETMPSHSAEHYRTKIAIYINWYRSRGFPEDIPEIQNSDLGFKDVPSWRRICKVLIKNDYWCKMLSFSVTKSRTYSAYMARMKKKREEWGLF